jgi:Xaa-Pro aminopeptidase
MRVFSDGEMTRRVRGFWREAATAGIDAAVFHTADNVYYMSGVPLLSAWGRPVLAALVENGAATLVHSWIEQRNAEQMSWIRDLRIYNDEENVQVAAVALLARFLHDQGTASRRVGVEEDHLSGGLARLLREALPGATFVNISPALDRLRLIKSDEELRLLRLGGELGKIGAKAFLEAVRVGATELEVVSHAVLEMNRALASRYPEGGSSSYAYCHSGLHTLTPHLHPTGRRLQRGDLIALNVFPVIWGYCMELERTFVLGEPTVEQQRALDAVNEAFDAGKAALRPGATAAEIDHLTRRILRDRGYGEFITHGTGHAHGIMIGAASREELGELRLYNPQRLAPGMVNSVEPGIYLPDLGGFRHSDVLIVTDSGAELVTDFPRDIRIAA